MIYMEFIPSSVIGLGFAILAIFLVALRLSKPHLSRGATC